MGMPRSPKPPEPSSQDALREHQQALLSAASYHRALAASLEDEAKTAWNSMASGKEGAN